MSSVSPLRRYPNASARSGRLASVPESCSMNTFSHPAACNASV